MNTAPRHPLHPLHRRIAPATLDHLPALRAIYAPYVLHALCSFEETVPDVDELARRFEASRGDGLPWLVCLEGAEVIGYAYASRYRTRAAYRGTVEDSIYIRQDRHGLGIGRQLLQALILDCRAGGFSQMVAVIGDSANAGSIRLHQRAGFEHVGVLRGVGHKFGRDVDTVLMQRPLALAGTAASSPSPMSEASSTSAATAPSLVASAA